MSNRAICASMKSSFTVNGVEISAGLIGLPQAQRPFGIIAHVGSSLPSLAAPNLLITSYPLVMVPTFAVPLALMLHGLVLWRLRREGRPTGRLAVASLA